MSKTYIALARKWRPKQFNEVVGQDHIVRTLSNAIQSDRTHHGYLFTGSRGVGKTTVARIFSKVLRCEKPVLKENWIESCDQCPSCKEITSGSSMDVLEIDGASNNGVDAIREIRENAKYLPSTGDRKIYIIDEVHMLTTAAFNALLKTLEEPPKHVSFIFATTEPHKIPATILSRCQRFDFRRVSPAQISGRLKTILESEKVAYEDNAIGTLSRAADGSMRDALSLLDQTCAHSSNKITLDILYDSIGLIRNDLVLNVAEAIVKKNVQNAIHFADQIYNNGFDLKVFLKSLIETFHTIILSKAGVSSTSLQASHSQEEIQRLMTFVHERPLEELELIFQALSYGFESTSKSPQPKATVDILLIKCATANSLLSIQSLNEPTTQKNQKSNSNTTPALEVAKHLSSDAASNRTANPNNILKKKEFSHEKLIHSFKSSRPLIGSLLEHAHDIQVKKVDDGGKIHLTLHFDESHSFKKDQLATPEYHKELLKVIQEEFGETAIIEFKTTSASTESPAEVKRKAVEAKIEETKNGVINNPIIKEAQSLFRGELDDIQVKNGDGTYTQIRN